MLRYLLKVTSLKNLYGNSEKGQIATLLLLMAVGILAFVLVTANLGNVANTATNLANAADASALYLASQLATRSNQLWEALDHDTEKCKKGGLLSLILAIVMVIIAVVIAIVTMGAGAFFAFAAANMAITMAAGAAIGAIGGAIGGAIAGTGAFRGALMGAVVGAAIGAGVSAIGTAVAAAPTTAPFAAVTAPLVSSTAMNTAIASATMSALGVGAKVYNAYVEDEMSFAAISSATKSINGLLEYDRYRENTFFQALSQTVDDSNKTDSDYVQLPVNDKTDTDGDGIIDRYDPYDTDGDGNKEEAVPYFQYWWDLRVRALKSIIPELEALTYLFLWGEEGKEYNTAKYREPYNPSLSKPPESIDYEHSFQDYAINQYSETYTCTLSSLTMSSPLVDGGSTTSNFVCPQDYSTEGGGYSYTPVWSSGLLYRTQDDGTPLTDWKRWIKCPQEYYGEGTSCKTGLATDPYGIDGVIVQVGKALDDKNMEVSFYKPGLTNRSDYDGEQEECKKKRDGNGEVVKKNGKIVYTCGDSKKDCNKNDDGTYTCGGKPYNENKGCAKKATCDDDMYNDEAEVVVSTLIDFKEAVKIIKSQSITRLTSTWQSWVSKFYDSDKKEVENECGDIEEKTKTKSVNFSDKFDTLINGEDLDNDGETGEEDVDVPVDSDNDGDTDYYEVKDEFKGLKAWKKEIKEKKNKYINKLSPCELSYSGGTDINGDGVADYYNNDSYYANYPCYDSASKVVTTDGDAADEFDEALTAIDELITKLKSFQASAKEYFQDMNDVYKKLRKKYGQTFDFGGINPVTYSWADSRCLAGKTFEKNSKGELDMDKVCNKDEDGKIDPTCPYKDTCDQDADGNTTEQYKCHSVAVEASQFKIPYIDEQKSGGFLMKKVCMVLTDYCYNPSGDPGWNCENSDTQDVWIKITRKDLGNQTVGSLGKWNATDTGDENQCAVSADCADWKEKNPGFKISRKAIPYFNYDKVGLAGAGKEAAKNEK